MTEIERKEARSKMIIERIEKFPRLVWNKKIVMPSDKICKK